MPLAPLRRRRATTPRPESPQAGFGGCLYGKVPEARIWWISASPFPRVERLGAPKGGVLVGLKGDCCF